MSDITFKIGDNVHYITNRGNKGAGKIVDVKNGKRGAWYSVLNLDGVVVKVRAGGMVHAKKKS